MMDGIQDAFFEGIWMMRLLPGKVRELRYIFYQGPILTWINFNLSMDK